MDVAEDEQSVDEEQIRWSRHIETDTVDSVTAMVIVREMHNLCHCKEALKRREALVAVYPKVSTPRREALYI